MNLMKRPVELEKQIQQVASLRSQCRFCEEPYELLNGELQYLATKQTVEVADNFNGLLRCVRNVVFARSRTHCVMGTAIYRDEANRRSRR